MHPECNYCDNVFLPSNYDGDLVYSSYGAK